jgi:hypothetical protein
VAKLAAGACGDAIWKKTAAGEPFVVGSLNVSDQFYQGDIVAGTDALMSASAATGARKMLATDGCRDSSSYILSALCEMMA